MTKFTPEKIVLWPSAHDRKLFTEGDYADDGNGARWILTRYSDDGLCSPRCQDDHCYLIHPSECAACGDYITEIDHYLCMDGGDSAHLGCVLIHVNYPHRSGTLPDCLACAPEGQDHDQW